MALICQTVTTYLTSTVLDPVDSWASQQEKKCSSKPWPKNWLCWFVTVLVEITTWVTREILSPITQVICTVVTGIIGGIMWPFSWAVDAVRGTFTAHEWVELWWLTPTKVKFINKEDSKVQIGQFDYTFNCKCKNGDKEIIVTAKDDTEAAELATIKCKDVC